jgi:methionine-rich copper-binding protein CopC
MLNLRWVLSVGLALSLVGLLPQSVFAHARPDRADPPVEGVVASAPGQLHVWFTQGVRNQGSSLEVTDSAGNRVDLGDGRVDLNDPDRKLMSVSLQALADGVYSVRWVTISADDGDTADGSFRFGVGASTVLPPAPPSTAGSH